MQWDTVEKRNPVSWYYAAGVDAEIRRRVLGAGGQYENVDIRASLIWNNRNDLDLHIITPTREEIYYANKRADCGGWLDTDMNVNGETDTPVENTRWSRGRARPGRYYVFVRNYRFHSPQSLPTPFKVELQVGENFFSFEGVIPANSWGTSSDVPAFEFDYFPGQSPKLRSAVGIARPQNNWNVTPGSYVPVTGITFSPNLWGTEVQEQHGRHVFFLLEDCRDMDGSQARGFFPESLKSEYREIRSVLEAYNIDAGVEGAETAQACGVGMSNHNEWNLTLRVTTINGISDYKLDRWD